MRRKPMPLGLLAVLAFEAGFAVSAISQEPASPSVTTSRVFVTAGNFSPTVGGALGAAGVDTKCQDRAVAAGLSGTWKAWLSGNHAGESASLRLTHATGPYKLLNGTTVAANWTALTSGTILHAIDRDEFGQIVSPGTGVWTGTNSDGTGTGGCQNWSSAVSGTVIIGVVGLTGSQWTNNGNGNCATQTWRFYCFQDPFEALASISGRVTSSSGRPIRHAHIVVTGGGLTTPLETYTVQNGNYTVTGVPVGATYTATVGQRRFTFSPASRSVALVDSSVSGNNYTANP